MTEKQMTDEELAEVIVSYCKDGDQNTPRAEIVKWVSGLIAESRKGIFTAAEVIVLHYDIMGKSPAEAMEYLKQYLTERKGR